MREEFQMPNFNEYDIIAEFSADPLPLAGCQVTLDPSHDRHVLAEDEPLIADRWASFAKRNPRAFNGTKFRLDGVVTTAEVDAPRCVMQVRTAVAQRLNGALR